jgi:hypothetical protein
MLPLRLTASVALGKSPSEYPALPRHGNSFRPMAVRVSVMSSFPMYYCGYKQSWHNVVVLGKVLYMKVDFGGQDLRVLRKSSQARTEQHREPLSKQVLQGLYHFSARQSSALSNKPLEDIPRGKPSQRPFRFLTKGKIRKSRASSPMRDIACNGERYNVG